MLRETTRWLIEAVDRSRRIRRRASHGRRDGISLLEVLISIFVLAIGLLGVAAVIPLGQLQAQRAVQSHRIAGMGQSKLREMQVGHMLDPRYWVYLSNSNQWEHVVTNNGNGVAGLPLKRAWFFDPLFIANNNNLNSSSIPSDTTASSLCPLRISMVAPHLAGNSSLPIQYPLAERMFTGTDDQIVSQSKDVNERPRQIVLSEYASGKWIGAAWPARAGDNLTADGKSVSISDVNDNPLIRDSQGSYSYLITIVPEATTPDFYANGHPYAYLDKLRLVVSVVVFHQRDLSLPNSSDRKKQLDPNIPSERNAIVSFEFGGGGWGGGDVILKADTAGELDLEENEWLMIHSKVASDYTHPAKWYQVVAFGEVRLESGMYQRRVTLSGPDWRFDLVPNNNDPPYPADAMAILMTNVAGVYTTTIQPDFHSAAWGLAN